MNSHPENKQCNAVLHVALPTALRAADGSKGGLTNIYLGLNHPRWIGCMQMSTRGLWLAVCKWVRTGVRNCSGKNNLAPRTPCDKFVYDFPCNFCFGIVDGYGLRQLLCVHIIYAHRANFFYGASGATRGKSVQRLCEDCTEIVQCQCSCRAVSASSARKSYGARAGIGLRTVPVRGLCNATYDMSILATGLRFSQICKNFSLSQIVQAAEPVNPYENLTAASCLRREASRRPHGKRDPGRTRAP